MTVEHNRAGYYGVCTRRIEGRESGWKHPICRLRYWKRAHDLDKAHGPRFTDETCSQLHVCRSLEVSA